ncbi:MAG: PorT family protein [Prevotella sp.]|nr:PorT family protein [Prevotella sp.]
MKKLFLVAIVMMASLSTFAQREVGTLSLQPRVGVSAADFNNTEDTKARVGFIAGAELEYYVSNMVGISAGMFYSQQGAEFEIGGADFTCKLDYVNVPIIANFYVWKGLALKTGIQPGFKMSSKLEGSYSGYAASAKMDDVNSIDLSVPVGISYDFGRVVLDARYNLGLTKIFKDDDYLDSKNLAFQLTIGYKFTL